jgi:Glutathione S-transferase, C-terminal domain
MPLQLNPFFDRPSALDTSIFSYLAPLFYIPWKNKDVRQELFMDSLDKFKNLKSYVDRIRKRYLDGKSPTLSRTPKN